MPVLHLRYSSYCVKARVEERCSFTNTLKAAAAAQHQRRHGQGMGPIMTERETEWTPLARIQEE